MPPRLGWFNPRKKMNLYTIDYGGGYNACVDGLWIDRMAKYLPNLDMFCSLPICSLEGFTHLSKCMAGWSAGCPTDRAAKNRGFDPENWCSRILGRISYDRIAWIKFSDSSLPTVMHWTSALHINFAIPVYTAYALTDGLTGRNTRDGDSIDAKLSDAFKFDAKTCPMALFHGGTDAYSPSSSVGSIVN